MRASGLTVMTAVIALMGWYKSYEAFLYHRPEFSSLFAAHAIVLTWVFWRRLWTASP